MSRRPTYEDEFFAWTQHQAQAIRALKADGALDLEHIAEEIEDVGKAELRAVSSSLRQMFTHLLKVHLAPGSTERAVWIERCMHFQTEAVQHFDESMREHVDVAAAWRKACEHAMQISSAKECPFDLDAVLTEGFDVGRAIEVVARARL